MRFDDFFDKRGNSLITRYKLAPTYIIFRIRMPNHAPDSYSASCCVSTAATELLGYWGTQETLPAARDWGFKA
jgi:hypothetical protein